MAKTKTTAGAEYARRAAEIERLIDLIRGELAAHATRAKADPANWGHAGDLGRVRDDLIEAYRSISQQEYASAAHEGGE
ncbi:MAG: hypothetical protein U0636_00100 [Phycisphaerales bacterium]